MPIKILLADDSMTAQKMGKDILTAAGYEVTAVSNGAAASKKLNDKFDVIILDINMPGYTGLEICEKVRASMEIAKTPVLLTSGKMEHYEPADIQRVKADGVIIKPFEATDLIAVVQKLVEKASAVPAPPPKPATREYEKTMIFTAPQIQEFKDQSYAEWKTEAPDQGEPQEAPPAPAFEMSHAEASAPAFAMDMGDPAPAATSMDETVRYEKPVAMPASEPSFDETVNFAPSAAASFDETVGFSSSAPAMDFGAAAAAPAFEMSAVSGFDAAPVAFESVSPEPLPSLEPTVMPGVKVTASADPDLEVHVEAKTEDYSIPVKDPALADRVEMASEEFITKIGTPEEVADAEMDAAAAEAAELAAAAAELAGESAAPEPAPAPVVDDFEARVAAAMSGFGSPDAKVAVEAVVAEPAAVVAEPEAFTEEATPVYEKTQKITAPVELPAIEVAEESGSAAIVEPIVEEVHESQAPPEGMQDAALVEQMQAAFADLPVETTPHIVEEPIAVVESAPEPMVMAAAEPPASGGPDMELASALAAAVGGEPPAAMAVAASSPAAAGMDPHTIAQVVTRVMERMLPSVMSEIAKELEAAKK